MGRKELKLTGNTYGRLRVIEKSISINSKVKYWKCICDCGNEVLVTGACLRNGRTKSCGCILKEIVNKQFKKDITNQKFGLLTAVKESGKTTNGEIIWECLCECGNMCNISGSVLRRKKGTKSCGCLQNKFQKNQMTGSKSPKWKGFKEVTGVYMNSLKHGARVRHLEFNINAEDIWNLFCKQNKKCALTGRSISFNLPGKNNKQSGTASVDRIDSMRGYTLDNIQLVHKDINMLKNKLSQEYFIAICKEVADYNKQI